jgi:hypothetical protein
VGRWGWGGLQLGQGSARLQPTLQPLPSSKKVSSSVSLHSQTALFLFLHRVQHGDKPRKRVNIELPSCSNIDVRQSSGAFLVAE